MTASDRLGFSLAGSARIRSYSTLSHRIRTAAKSLSWAAQLLYSSVNVAIQSLSVGTGCRASMEAHGEYTKERKKMFSMSNLAILTVPISEDHAGESCSCSMEALSSGRGGVVAGNGQRATVRMWRKRGVPQRPSRHSASSMSLRWFVVVSTVAC